MPRRTPWRSSALVFLVTCAAPSACSLLTDTSGLSTGQSATLPSDAAPEAVTADAPAIDAATTDASARPDAFDPVAAYVAAVRDDDPIGYYRLEDKPGTGNARDEIGQHPAAVFGNVVFGTPAVAGSGARFDGTSYLDVGDAFGFTGSQPYSIEFWANPVFNSEPFHEVANKRNAQGYGLVFYFRDDGPSPGVQLEQVWTTGARGGWSDVRAGAFMHVVCTYDPAAQSSTVHIYVNAIQSPSVYDDGDGGPASDPTTPFRWAPSFIGVLDELAVYYHALSSQRVQAHFDAAPK